MPRHVRTPSPLEPVFLSLLCTAFVGCAAADGRTALAPGRDPTPLAKCQVAASASSPLVTEWPASEKAHLESLTAGQSVAVEYAGCELHIVDACKLPGKYTWQKTTIATDTVEINNEDELYSKLPLGAVSLEGELRRSGRLAVRTTVTGQLKLGEIDTSNVPREGACARVTHVISAVSVGAFKLLSGGALAARGSASVVGVGAAAGTKREEEVMREAGDPKKCGDATAERPNAECASPIQLFLQPVQRTKTAEEKKAADAEREAEQRGGVRVVFTPASPEEKWTLRTSSGDLLCPLPCTRWIGAASGYYLQRDEALASGFTRVPVPESLPYPSGSSVEVKVEPPRGSFVGPLVTGGLSVGVGIVGALMLGQTKSDPRHPLAAIDPAIGVSVVTVGTLGLAASAVWFFWSHGWRLETTRMENKAASQTLSVSPGGVVGVF